MQKKFGEILDSFISLADAAAAQLLGRQRSGSSASMQDKQRFCYAEDLWLSVFAHCAAPKLCQLARTCKMFRSVAPEAATAQLLPTGRFSAELCDFLNDLGGKTVNDLQHRSITELTVTKLHEVALARLNVLSVKIFFGIIKNEVQIHGVRLITNFYKTGVLRRHTSEFSSSIKQLFYYETTSSKVMDLVMLQGVLCHVFQMSVEHVAQFSLARSQQMNTLREKKIDGTNITQVLNSMMTWTETRSLMDELHEHEYAIAWPNTAITHRMLQGMLGTQDFDDINLFMTNILKSIQTPFSSFADLNNSERSFMLGTKTCYSKFCFESEGCSESYDDSYMCVMDLTEGIVMCRGGRMSIKISFNTSLLAHMTPIASGNPSAKKHTKVLWVLG
jgi:hypothetical protein